MSLLEVENLNLSIGKVPILRDISFAIERGETRALVGESGSGKSMTSLAIMQLLPFGAKTSGEIRFVGENLLTASEAHMCELRGDQIGMVFQEPMTALNPVKTIGEQVAEGIRIHTGASRANAEEQAMRILDRVGLPSSRFPLSRYPHQLSGGQRQRVVIAMATALKPQLLIADEPTTALDVVLQAQILDLLRDLVRENDMGLLLISHDLAVVAEMADTITIMRRGEVMESGETATVLSRQAHPYTRQLALASTHVPERHGQIVLPERQNRAPLLEISGLTRTYPGQRTGLFTRGPDTTALNDVSLSIQHGESVALVGRSGCGKSTLARLALALDQPTSGSIRFEGLDVAGRTQSELRPVRRQMQVVFQDPYGSLDPRQTVTSIIAEPLHLLDEKPSPSQRRDKVVSALEEVGLSAADLDKYPHEFSGGQRQRLSIARALITRPKLIVADEAVSALDVSIRAQILDLFLNINERLGIAYLFITHDLGVAKAITDTVLVMHEGQIVERGPTLSVLEKPQADATKMLVSATPDLHRAINRKLVEQG